MFNDIFFFLLKEYVKLSTTATTSQPQLSHNSMMAPLMQTMNPLTNNPMSSQISQHLHSNNPQMMYGASATQPVGNMSGMVQQSFYRPEGFSGGFNPNVSLLQQQQQQQPMTAATSIQPGTVYPTYSTTYSDCTYNTISVLLIVCTRTSNVHIL